MGEACCLRLLGPVQVEREGEPMRGFESRKALALLCYLAVQHQPVSRSHLADLFWGDKPEARGRGNLSRVLHNLSSLLPGCLQADRHTVQFHRSATYWLDVDAFNERVAQGDAGSLATAVELYRGDFLEGLHLNGCPDFEIWLVRERERWRQRVIQALHTLIDYHARRGEYDQGLRFASRLLALDPWREEAHRQMMLLLALTGQRSAALTQYETCRRILAEELGIEPGTETTALYERIRDEEEGSGFELQVEGSRPEATTFNLPAPEPATRPLPFVGRAEEHAWLVRQWEAARRGMGKFTLVEGEAGMGKTRLVEEVLRYARSRGARLLRGRCYEFGTDVPYQPIAEALRSALNVQSSALNVLSPVWLAELARLLPEVREIQPELPESHQVSGEAARQRLFEAAARLLQALIDQRRAAILFLDDLHWADPATVDLLRYLLHRLPDTPLWFLGAYRREEMDLDHPFLLLRRALAQEQRVALLRLSRLSPEAIAELTRALPGLDDEQARELAVHLSRRSEGSPFILEQLLQELEEPEASDLRFRISDFGMTQIANPKSEIRNPRSVPFGVREMILGRVGRLSPSALHLLHLAAVIGRGFEPDLLQEAAGPGEAISDGLVECLARRLISHHPPPSSPRSPSGALHSPPSAAYDFTHDMIRQVVYESLPPWQRQRLHRQVAAALERLHQGREAEVVERLAYHYTASGDGTRALAYLLRAAERAEETYAWDAAIRCYDQALTLLPADALEGRYEILARRERDHNRAARRDAQDADLSSLEDLARRLKDDARHAEVLTRRVEWAVRTGRFAMGVEMARQAVDLAQHCARPDIAAESLRQGAVCWSYQGDYERARRWGRQALTLHDQQGDERGRALVLGSLGVVALGHGFLEEAQGYMEEAAAQWRALGDPWSLAGSLNNLSMLYHRLGDYGRALECQLEARRLAPQTGDLDLNAHSLTSLGIIYHALGRYKEALVAYREALTLARTAADRKIEGYALLCQAHTLWASGQVAEAGACYRKSLAIQEELDIPVFRAETLNGLADCLLARGKVEDALALLAEAEASFQEAKQPGISETLVRQAEAHVAGGNLDQARQAMERFRAVVEGPDSREELTPEIWWRAGRALQACGDEAQGRRMLELGDRLLKEQAARLTDPDLCRSFLDAAAVYRAPAD